MKTYTNEVQINLPRKEVIALFDNPDNLSKWQPGFVSIELIKGKNSEVGAQHRLNYKMGKRDIEMVETILSNDLPDSIHFKYEAKNVVNTIENYFEELSDGSTKYWTKNEFKLSGSMKFFGWIMPGAFKKQSQKYLDLFKQFAEEQAA